VWAIYTVHVVLHFIIVALDNNMQKINKSDVIPSHRSRFSVACSLTRLNAHEVVAVSPTAAVVELFADVSFMVVVPALETAPAAPGLG
jgi:hypothetical protein